MNEDDDLNESNLLHMQIYSPLIVSQDSSRKIIDFTEYKLNKFAKNISDKQQRNALNELLKKYKEGIIAVGWHRGNPTWAPLRRD
jgi:hypothetical protein